MVENVKIGVYICECGINFSKAVDIKNIVEFAKTHPNVIESTYQNFMCSIQGQNLIIEDIQSKGINKIVIAACSPNNYKSLFSYACEKTGLNPGLIEIIDLSDFSRQFESGDKELAYSLVKDSIKAAIIKVSDLKPIEFTSVPVEPSCLIIGAGIAGMNAALDLTKRGYEVHLVEKEPSIGGHMAQLDKTFPTLDCSSCILTPLMSEVGKEKKIHLYTYSEVVSVEGYVGNFYAIIKKKPHYIDQDKCNGCGICAEVCPVECGNEFDLGMKSRKAPYIPFPQAIPRKFTIDMVHCIRCGICADECLSKAVNYNDSAEFVKLKVGTVIITTGWDSFDPTKLKEYGYNRYPNVITGLQLERLLSSFGPTGGKVKRPSDLKVPDSIIFQQCVGSRDFRDHGNKYCSRVCCMYATKQARQIKEKYPNTQVIIFYIDLRAFGKGYEEFYESAAREYGIIYIRGRIGEVYEDKDHNINVRGEDTLIQRMLELQTDLLVLSTGIEAPQDSDEIIRLFNLIKSEDGFIMEAHLKMFPVDTLNQGIFVAGAAQGPKDIPDTVAQAKAAASSAASLLSHKRIEIEASRIMKVEELERPELEIEKLKVE